MRQAIDIREHCGRVRQRASWRARLRAWLIGPGDSRRLIPLDQRSAHLLRDIGLAEDVRANPLLRDHHLFRR
jgi:hypothetical protein